MGNFTANLEREISHTKLTALEPPWIMDDVLIEEMRKRVETGGSSMGSCHSSSA